ncbi:ATP synthase subunit I [Celerinatantimonas sp. YJH-8]|uniref:ATP synthase subunit I n=1 Tax=Celerinatantimonas sp. YJH-8 TaxID=3228714 RepID=UPI0038BFD13E
MSERFVEYTHTRVVRLIGYQACFIFMMALGATVTENTSYIFSVILGSIVFFIPNWFFISFSMLFDRWNEDAFGVKKIYIGQAVKLVLVLGLGAISLHFFSLNGLCFLLAFIGSVIVHCFTLLLIFQNKR